MRLIEDQFSFHETQESQKISFLIPYSTSSFAYFRIHFAHQEKDRSDIATTIPIYIYPDSISLKICSIIYILKFLIWSSSGYNPTQTEPNPRSEVAISVYFLQHLSTLAENTFHQYLPTDLHTPIRQQRLIYSFEHMGVYQISYLIFFCH